MKKFTKIVGVTLALASLVALLGAVVFWWSADTAPLPSQAAPATPNAPVAVAPQAPAAAPVLPAAPAVIQHPIEAIAIPAKPEPPQLPTLNASDTPVRRALAQWMADTDSLRFLQPGQFIRHLVATVDNLPREHASAVIWPVNPMPGHFSTGDGDGRNPLGPSLIHAGNSARYTPFVDFVTALDTANAVAMYVQFYPLFQQAYVELGYPKAYFNDRLVAVIDHLLAAPVTIAPLEVSRVEVRGPYQALRPWVTYEFTDPALRAMSAGQKMLLRTGAVNHQRLRTKLMAIRRHLTQTPLNNPRR